MSSLLKSKNTSAVNFGKIIGGAGVGAVVLAFFFLPEILGLKSDDAETAQKDAEIVVAKASPTPRIEDLMNAKIEEEPAVQQDAVVEVAIAQPVETARPIDTEIRSIADVDLQLANLKANNENEEKAAAAKKAQADLPICIPPEQVEEAKDAPLIPVEGPITWDVFKNPAVIDLLAQAQGKTQALIAVLPVEHSRSHFELSSYLNALQTIAAGPGATRYSPEEALKYIDYRDSSVSKALSEENVTRATLTQWQDISLAPILQESFSQRAKAKIIKPYKPKLYVSDVLFRYDWVGEAKKHRQQPLRASIRGYVLGKETAHIEWYNAHNSVYPIHAVLSPADHRGRRFFDIPYHGDIKKEYITIMAVASDGAKFLKRYNFSKAKGLPTKNDGTGVYYSKLPFKAFDPRMDRIFLAKQAVVSEDGSLKLGSFSNRPIATF